MSDQVKACLEWIEASNKDELAEAIVERVAADLKASVEKQGRASILLSGGGTPQAAYQLLSKADLPWEKLQFSLSDERNALAYSEIYEPLIFQRQKHIPYNRSANFVLFG